MTFKTLRDYDLTGKTVLVRVDLNVTMHDGIVTSTKKIDVLKPTIDFLIKNNAKTILISHRGRPKDREEDLSLKTLPPILKKQWGIDVAFAGDCAGDEAATMAASLKSGDVGLLENTRFWHGETKNDPELAKAMAKLGDIYVNDAFSASHRAHVSTEGLAHFLPSAAGLLLEKELAALETALGNPEKPVAAITGGSKISTKIALLNNLAEKVDYLILGGGMANTFLFAQGKDIGNSLCEKEMVEEAQKIMAHAKEQNCNIILPSDVVTVKNLDKSSACKTVSTDRIPDDEMAVDIGPETVSLITEKIKNCKTLIWNGPMGVFEIKPFDEGTNALARATAELTQSGGLKSIAGGGDTVAALENAGVTEQLTYVSTAGGAFLEWMEGKTLPGVAALNTNSKDN